MPNEKIGRPGHFEPPQKNQPYRDTDARGVAVSPLRTCLDGFAANERKAARRLKRGGGQAHLSLDFEGAEEELRRHGAGEGLDVEA